ncbi:outer membrane beta-barrel protein [Parasegetibacter sp. NRK P23]|uniref:outer membrane beta-barrel protein n=1 Tax=Parasegetibacter sp. NRK P23 TaxID=2942999 RepID=UPI002043DF2D|nr:outer membrane beta-barrel protein [Parasegetibacter sp. NRK P23]MCM5528715.1 TonB-dependent receptor [Parasegetibacter sp. NRK P23]
MKNLCLLVVASVYSLSLFAQPPAQDGPPRVKDGKLYGRITDEKTKKGIDAASVQLFIVKEQDGIFKDSLVRGMLTKPNGDFSFEGLPLNDSLKMMLSAVGYAFTEYGLNPIGATGAQDAGNIKLAPEATVLDNVTVTASRPTMQMGIDRKVFNVEKNLMATGGTAVDIMRNIPSITVDVEGNIELRNSTPQIFIDGRPTILTLEQIPADNIERVELITNPSAKFDAASGGGIINVILKKNRRLGFNGTVSAGIGTPEVLNGNANLNLREGKFNFFLSGGYNQSGGVARGETFRQNKVNGVTDNFFNQYNRNERDRKFNNIRYGIDYFLDNRNTLSVSQNLTDGRFANRETQDQEYLNSAGILERTGYRVSSGRNGFKRNNVQLNYKHLFNSSGKELTADATYNGGSGTNTTNILNTYTNADGTEYASPSNVRNAGSSDNDQWTFQLDYVNPINDTRKIETGLRSFINNSNSMFSTFSIDNGGAETKLPLSNNYSFRELVHAGYFTYTDQFKGIGYQAGLRTEISDFEGTLIDSARTFGYKYPNQLKDIWDALFPSLYLSKQVSENTELQLNYSRRIRRPGFRQVNPFIDINDPVNLQQGNPELRPEFTNSLEFNLNQKYKKGNFLGVIYYRNNNGDITQYSDTISAAQYQQLNNAAVDPNAILNTYINAQSTNRLGLELTLQHKFTRNFDIVPTMNFQYRKVNANVGDLNLSNEGFNWESKLIVNYKITNASPVFNNLGFQVTGEYESPEIIPQGRRKEQYGVDFAMRKDLFKDNKGNITFAIDDVFNSKRFGTIYDTDAFYQDSYRRWRVRTFRVTLSYRFGDNNFSLFNRRRGGGEERSGDDMEG